MTSVTPEPQRSRPNMPRDYGVPEQDDGLLPWSWALERLLRGWPDTIRMRNILARGDMVVQVQAGGDDVVILEGKGGDGGRPSADLARRLADGFAGKYGQSHDYRPQATQWDNGGLWVMRPTKAFGWGEFPKTVTRWMF